MDRGIHVIHPDAMKTSAFTLPTYDSIFVSNNQ
jgi:hypothetical protein